MLASHWVLLSNADSANSLETQRVGIESGKRYEYICGNQLVGDGLLDCQRLHKMAWITSISGCGQWKALRLVSKRGRFENDNNSTLKCFVHWRLYS